MTQSYHTDAAGHGRQPDSEPPRDGFGPGYLVYSLAADFHALCCMIGKENARQEMAEVINAEFQRSARYGS